MATFDPSTVIILAAASSGTLIALAVGMAYRMGRECGLRSRSDRFDRLYVEVDFHGSQWTVCDTSNAHSAKVVGTITLHQAGARVLAEGMDSENRPWSAEGVAFRRGVHLLFLERRARGHAVGSLHLRLAGTGQLMTGMKMTWEGDQIGGAIQTVTWHRTSPNDAVLMTGDVAFREHSSATVANQQQSDNVFHPVDRLAREVVEATSSPSQSGFEMRNR
jgi:hypothetical protein